jgi:hypothetical protein
MLRILGSPKTDCTGLTRRDLLTAGSLSLFGLPLSALLRHRSAEAALTGDNLAASFGHAKSCILMYLYGAPSQLETVDMKPDAPREIRGDMKPIPSRLPGLDVCEHLPEMAKMMDRVTVVRSLSHEYPIHGVAFALTGVPSIEVAMELSPYDVRHWPFIGSVVDYLHRQSHPGPASVPQNIGLPFRFSSRRTGEVDRAGPYAAFLGSSYNPVWVEFEGKATRTVVRTLQEKRLEAWDPYLGIEPNCRFDLASAGAPAEGITLDRLDRRRHLLEQFDQRRRELGDSSPGRSLDRFQQLAFSLISSRKVADALDISREPPKTREQYGMTLFGQSALVARRLVEAGTKLVTVFWDEFGLAGTGWDTHWDHYPRMVDELLPGLDRAFAGLVTDLEQRGLLDETLVVCISEHGRTPKIFDNRNGGGRDHWSRVYSGLFAGGGIARGKVVGASDKQAGEPADRPVSPKDVLATIYHALGIDPETRIPNRTGRTFPLVAHGQVVPEMLA